MVEYIERRVLMEKFKESYCKDCQNYNGVRCSACCNAIDILKSIPPVAIKNLHPMAEWIVTDEERDCACCSRCGWYIDRPHASFAIPRYKYCPNCGARMEEKE